MALVSFAFSTLLPPCRFSVLKKFDGHPWTRTGNLVSFSRSSYAVLSKMQRDVSKGTITIKNLNSHCSVRANSENPCMFFTNFCDVGCCSQVISGYWIGPDPEDGWGFVEAFSNKIC